MKLRRHEQATVSEQKLTQYLLSLNHPAGSGKARYFIGHGFSVASWHAFADALLRHAAENEVAAILQTQRGASYTVEGLLTSPKGEESPVRVVWFQDHREPAPHLVTAYPLKRAKR